MTFFVPRGKGGAEDILKEQFLLIYHGHFNYLDVEMMSPLERYRFLDMLVKQKERELNAVKETSKPKGKSIGRPRAG